MRNCDVLDMVVLDELLLAADLKQGKRNKIFKQKVLTMSRRK